MQKTKKIETVVELLVKPDKQSLTPGELSFLKSRGVSVADNKAPLMIFSYDSKKTESIIRGIALKTKAPVIKIVKLIIKQPDVIRSYPEPIKEEVIPEPKLAVMEPEPEAVEVEAMEVREPEALAEGIRNGNYKLSFPSVWANMDEDDSIDMNIPVKQRSALR
jgi:hypothetical protein